jgi:cell growth-regulating nucleolar protein
MVHFYGLEYRTHTSCISEAQKYQGALYRPEKEKKKGQNNNNNNNNNRAQAPPRPYVEDVAQPPPQAPSPPAAADNVNVFDFLVNGETPNASQVDIAAPEPTRMIEDTPAPANETMTEGTLVEYGSGPVAPDAFSTPASKAERRKKDGNREEKKDKKRKRLHVDTQDHSFEQVGDEVMTDAPPVLHSGLTGGLNRLLTRPSEFPPSPDYSGGDAAEASPGTPLKKKKKSSKKHSTKPPSFTDGLLSLISTKPHKKSDAQKKKRKAEKTAQKLLENKAHGEDDAENQMVLYQQRAELFMSFVNKGPQSDKGCSMNKALKRYHRERDAQGSELGRSEEEKELWRCLRLKRNEQGEVVVFFEPTA